MARVAVDAGRAGAKRLADAGAGRTRTVADGGALRARRVEAGEAARACLDWAGRGVGPGEALDGLAVVAATEAEARELGEALRRAAPGVASVVIAAPVAAALALAEERPPDGALDAVLDLGHAALRLSLVRWHRVGDDAYPRLERTLERPRGGAAIDEALLARAVVEGAPAAGAAAALPVHELKELVGAGRGPWVRAWPQPSGPPAVVTLPARGGADALLGALEELHAALTELAAAAAEAGARRALLVGGLLHLAPVRRAVDDALAAARLVGVAAPDPMFAAPRGALRALDRSPVPRAASSMKLVLRDGRGVTARELVPQGAALPARFGPIRAHAARGGEVAVHVLDGEQVLEARCAPGEGAGDVWLGWSFAAGWTLEAGGQERPLAPAPVAAARAVKEALAFDWAAHSQAVPVDVAFVFRATKGGGDAALRPVGEAIGRLAEAAAGASADVRLRAIAVGDHPQGHMRPAYVTKLQPAWAAKADGLAAFVKERLADPVDGIDAPEAYEAGLKDAAGLDWRPDAEKLLLVLADVPPHVPEEPPFCPIDWRQELKRLRERGVRVVPVHVAVGGVPPALRKQALEFLGGLAERVETLRSATPGPELLATVAAAATTRRMNPAARRVLDAVALLAE